MRVPARMLAPIVVLVALAGAGASTVSATVLPHGFVEHTIATRLVDPVDVEWAPDGRMFVAEKAGRVVVIGPDGTRRAQPVVDISGHVTNFVDRGLTGIAVDRDFASNGYLYLLYAYRANTDPTAPQVWRLSRVVVQPDNALANPSDPETIVLGEVATAPCPPPDNASDCIASDDRNHQGGTVRSDPEDGTLWVGFGDDSQFDVPNAHAFRTYDERSFAGKILHVDRDGRGLAGHPFCPADQDLDHVCTKVFAKGFRNPFRFTVSADGVIVGDVGSRSREEIDLVAAGGNYGWPCYEGSEHTAEYASQPACATEYAKEGTAEASLPPVYDYSHEGGTASITGGPIYAGSRFPATYQGAVFFADYVKGTLQALRLGAGDQFAGVEPLGRALGATVDIEAAADGSLTLVDIRYGAVRQLRYEDGDGGSSSGGLSLSGCIGVELPGCVSPDATGALDGLNGLAIDGRDLYATAIRSGTLNHLTRTPGGGLTLRGCISSSAPGCAPVGPVDAMKGTHTAALSPDGASLYTASDTTGTVEHFELDPATGDPTFAGCIGRDRVGCDQLPVDALRGAHTAVVGDDGRHVYVTAVRSDAVVQFDRNAETGNLTFAGCDARAVVGCDVLGGANAVNDPHDAKLSPDGATMYVPGYAGDSIARFSRDPSTGAVSFLDCVGQAATGCTDLGSTDALDGVHGVAISPDGNDLYAASGLSGTLSRFDLDDGTMAFAGCIGRDAAGCARLGGNGLEGAHWVTVSPDGRSVYVAARESSAVTRFDRDPATGSLTYRGCVAQGAAGCENLSPLEPLGGEVDWVELSPDSATLFTTSFGGNALAEFAVGGDATPAHGEAGPLGARADGRAFRVRVRIARARLLEGTGIAGGSVRSADSRCRAGANVHLLRAVRGPDVLETKDRADRMGRFRLELGPQSSSGPRLYVRVRARKLEGGDRCRAASSATFRARARG